MCLPGGCPSRLGVLLRCPHYRPKLWRRENKGRAYPGDVFDLHDREPPAPYVSRVAGLVVKTRRPARPRRLKRGWSLRVAPRPHRPLHWRWPTCGWGCAPPACWPRPLSCMSRWPWCANAGHDWCWLGRCFRIRGRDLLDGRLDLGGGIGTHIGGRDAAADSRRVGLPDSLSTRSRRPPWRRHHAGCG